MDKGQRRRNYLYKNRSQMVKWSTNGQLNGQPLNACLKHIFFKKLTMLTIIRNKTRYEAKGKMKISIFTIFIIYLSLIPKHGQHGQLPSSERYFTVNLRSTYGQLTGEKGAK